MPVVEPHSGVGGDAFPHGLVLQPPAQTAGVDAQYAADVLEGEDEVVTLSHDPTLGFLEQLLLAGIARPTILPVALDRFRQHRSQQLALALVPQPMCVSGIEELDWQYDLGLKQPLLVPLHAGVMTYRGALVYS